MCWCNVLYCSVICNDAALGSDWTSELSHTVAGSHSMNVARQ